MRLAIICGHEEKAKGAYSPILKAWEYDYNKVLAADIYREASAYGKDKFDCKVFFRDGLGIEKVGELVNTFCGNDGVAIELHFNSAAKNVQKTDENGNLLWLDEWKTKPLMISVPDPAPNGIETLYDADPVESKRFAGIVHEHLKRALREPNPAYNKFNKDKNPFKEPKDRGLKLIEDKDRGHRNLKAVKVPSCLLEPFFAHNKLDVERWMRNRQKCVEAIVRSVIDYRMATVKMD